MDYGSPNNPPAVPGGAGVTTPSRGLAGSRGINPLVRVATNEDIKAAEQPPPIQQSEQVDTHLAGHIRRAWNQELILGVGSVEEIRKGQFPLDRAPLVVANILAPVIVRLLDAGLARLIEGQGSILLSGILEDQAGRVTEAGQARGLILKERRQIGDWVALRMDVGS